MPPPPNQNLARLSACLAACLLRPQLVEARFGGKAKYFSGKIVKVHEEELAYDIDYDDGDQEEEVGPWP